MSMNVPPPTGPRMPPPAGGPSGPATGIPPQPAGAPRPRQTHPHTGPGGIPPYPSAPPNMPPPRPDGGPPGADMPRGTSDPRFGYSSATPNSSRGRKATLIKETLLGAFATINAIIHDGPMPNTQPGPPDGQSYSASYPQYMQPNQAAPGGSMLKASGNVFMGLMLLQSLGTGAIVSMLPSMLLLGAISLAAGFVWHRIRQPRQQTAGGADGVSSNDASPADRQMYAGGQQTSAQAPRQTQQQGPGQPPPQYGPPQQPPQSPQYGPPQQTGGLVTVPPGATAPGAAVRRPIAALEAGPSARATTAPAAGETAEPAVDPRIAGWGAARPASPRPPRREPPGFPRTPTAAEETPATETP